MKDCFVKCFDNGGKSIDRYTVVFFQENDTIHECISMSDNPKHPLGVCLHSDCQIGSHLGKAIPLESLPQDCQDIVNEELGL